MIKRIADDLFISWHDNHVAAAVELLQDEGYEVYKIVDVKRPLFGWDVIFSGNITDIYYKRVSQKEEE